MKKLLNIGLLVVIVVFLNACESKKSTTNPSTVISDSQGITISLTWSIPSGGSATSLADIDLYLKKKSDNTTIASSLSASFFETLTLSSSTLADTEYVVQVFYYGGKNVAVDYTVTVTGRSTSTSKTFNGTFLSTDKNLTADIAKITKSGTSFTVANI